MFFLDHLLSVMWFIIGVCILLVVAINVIEWMF